MDWVDYVPGDGFYPAPEQQQQHADASDASAPGGSYDAIRVYLWAGMLDRRESARAHSRCHPRYERVSWQSWCAP